MSGRWSTRRVRILLLLALLVVWGLVLLASWRDGQREAVTAAPLGRASAPASPAPRPASAPQR